MMAKKQRKRNGKKTQKPQGPVTEIRSAQQLDALLDSDNPVVIDFWAPWCGPCKAMSPVYEQVARQFADKAGEGDASDTGEPRKVQFVKVNTEAVPEIASEFNIRSIPTLAVLHGGEIIDSNIGLTSADALSRMAQRALDRAEGRTFGQRLKRFFAAAS